MTCTPEYAAPEQRAGDAEVTPSVDIYALGAILYEGLTGRPPFSAWEPQETVRQTLEDEPVPPRRLQPIVPRDLETICLKCLAKQPNCRYFSAEALANDLRRFVDGEAIETCPDAATAMGWKWFRRSALAAGLLAGIGLLALLGVAMIWWN
jgi:serine/threonine protein kinase